MAMLDIQDLRVRFETPEGPVHAVQGLSLELEPCETLGIVGESGSGKSQSMLAVMGLLARNGQAQGSVRFEGSELLGLPAHELNALRGNRMAMIFQDPMTALNPYLTVDRQLTEVLELHRGMTRRAARTRAIETLEAVRIPDAAQRIGRYPHEFSGGMRQRVMIAMALLCEPALLIADEPTTALDVTVQAQILELLRELQRTHGTAIVLITHDLGVVAGLCDRVQVMYAGGVMEQGSAEDLFYRPAHPYTRALLDARPSLRQPTGTPLRAIPGLPPSLLSPPPGCAFAPRCAFAEARCASQVPVLEPVTPTLGGGSDHRRACYASIDRARQTDIDSAPWHEAAR